MEFDNKIRSIFILSACLFGAPASAEQSSDDRSSQVIYDYELGIESMRVQASDRGTLTSLEPVDLVLEGTVRTGWRIRSISGAVGGMSLPHPDFENAREYRSLVREGDVIYTEPHLEAIARVDAEGQVIPEPQWSWRVTYREYRYSLADRVLGLILGIHFENQDALFVELDPQ